MFKSFQRHLKHFVACQLDTVASQSTLESIMQHIAELFKGSYRHIFLFSIMKCRVYKLIISVQYLNYKKQRPKRLSDILSAWETIKHRLVKMVERSKF